MKKSFVVFGGNFLFLSRELKISERPDLTKTQERQRQAFISQTYFIYREEDNRHK